MITEKEKINIILGFKKIQAGIDRLLAMLNKFIEKEDEVTLIFSTHFPKENESSRLNDFIQCKNNLNFLKNSFATSPILEDTTSDQYKKFLQTEIVRVNPETVLLLQQKIQIKILDFLDKHNFAQLDITSEDSFIIASMKDVPRKYLEYIDKLLDF